MQLSLVHAALLLAGAGALATARAQISAPTPEELSAVPAGHQDIAHGLGPVGGNISGKNPNDPGARGFGPDGPIGPPLPSASDPRDLRGYWAGGHTVQRSFPEGDRPGPRVKSRYEIALLCLVPPGVQPAGGQIFQTPDMITWATGNDLRARRILMNRRHSDNVTPTYGGNSVAHWEGDTLVVDTVGLQGTFGYVGSSFHRPGADIYDQVTKVKGEKLPPPSQYFQNIVVMATPTLHVIERLQKINHNTQLQDDMSFDDRATGMNPYSMRVIYYFAQPPEYIEQICEDGNDLFGPAYADALDHPQGK